MIHPHDIENVIHALNVPPLSARADDIRASVADMIRQMVDRGSDAAELVLTCAGDRLYINVGPPPTAEESAARAAAFADEFGLAGGT